MLPSFPLNCTEPGEVGMEVGACHVGVGVIASSVERCSHYIPMPSPSFSFLHLLLAIAVAFILSFTNRKSTGLLPSFNTLKP